jgi:predicted nucleic acid-binding protein
MDSNSYIIDSSIIIAAYDTNDTLHDRALVLIKNIENKTLHLHPYVIQEVVTVLSYRFGSIVAKIFLENVKIAENLSIPFVLDVKGEMEFFGKLNKKISFTDASLVKMARDKRIPVLTFDKQIISILKTINF